MLGIFKESSKFENGIFRFKVRCAGSQLREEKFILSTIAR
jgi:hypothetical protein